MEFNQLVKERYSCKKFNGEQVPQEKILEILEAGRVAPTAKNLQEQHIYVVQDPKVLAVIDEVTPCRYHAPTVMVVAFNSKDVFTYPGGTRDSGVEDASIVATHLILAAANANVDSCWINNFNPEVLKEKLNLPEDEEILMLLDLGYKVEEFKPLPNHTSRKPLEDTVTFL